MEVAELVAAEPVRRQRRQVPSAPAEWNGKRMRGYRTGIDCYIRIDLYLKQTGAVRLLHLSFALSSAVLSIQIVFFSASPNAISLNLIRLPLQRPAK